MIRNFSDIITKIKKKFIWKKIGDFENTTYKEREKAIKDYIFLSKPIMKYKDFMKLPVYNRNSYEYNIEYRIEERKANQIDGYTITLYKDKNHELKSYRFI